MERPRRRSLLSVPSWSPRAAKPAAPSVEDVQRNLRTSRRQLDARAARPGSVSAAQFYGPVGTTYFKGHIFGPVLLLLHLSGSVIPRVLPWAGAAVPYAVLMRRYYFYYEMGSGQTANHVNELVLHPFAYQAIMLTSGFCLVFRLNQSLQRYWEARTAAQSAASKWADGLVMMLAFDEDEQRADDCARFGRACLHLVSLLHAVAMNTLRGDNTLKTVVCRRLDGKASAGASTASPCISLYLR